MAIQCGICSAKEIPSRFSYYRFVKKLISHRDSIITCMVKTIEVIKMKHPDFGDIIAVDSTMFQLMQNAIKNHLPIRMQSGDIRKIAMVMK